MIFDYLPAVLLHLMEEQKRQAQRLEANAQFLDIVKTSVDAAGVQNKANINELQAQIQNLQTLLGEKIDTLGGLQTSIGERLDDLGRGYESALEETNKGFKSVSSDFDSLAKDNQKSHLKIMRLVIAGLVGSVLLIGLAIAILQRH